MCKIWIWLALGFAASGSAATTTAWPEWKQTLCRELLQSPGATLDLPLDARSAVALLAELGLIHPLTIGQPATPPALIVDRKVQSYLRHVSNRLENHGDPNLKLVAVRLSNSMLKPVAAVNFVGVENTSAKLAAHALAEVSNELAKLPVALLRPSQRLGRTMFVTLGAITQSPLMADMKGVVPRGWDKPWDVIPGAGGGRLGAVVNAESLTSGHGSANLTLHEVLHNVDYANHDLTGKALSNQPEFLRLWRETYYHKDDGYMRNYPEESFAEFGAWYFHSPASREMLRDLYPQWFEYFRKLEAPAKIF